MLLRRLSGPNLTPKAEIGILADISTYETGLGRLGLVIFAN